MTRALSGAHVARRIDETYPATVLDWNDTDVWVSPENLLKVARLLHESPDLDFALLRSVTAVDYVEYFELIYHLVSLRRNRGVVLKTRCHGRAEPSVPSVVDVWRGAELQEREIWDLMGVRFDGHPNMKRIMLWEGFPGHPLRKDFVR